ncbi:S-adenosyl-L-methionine-dependent methyltransferase [Microthyrium microscopicum]|uniref:S-adenosyl-L-methionine-dependent methyltransferase n=1 Tax=Microthyrium microscopicum TaxID=703497 RepID=A0A6A6UFI0_9PEZI|nr:S-adenosyl-L-methionine-dependent methyltransferase [Microthyrium microscopicum]
MSLNSFAHLYEEATIDAARVPILVIIKEHLPPLLPDLHILDLACGSGSVTRVIYEHCEAEHIQPPQITAVDVGPNFIEAFNENKKARNWHTAEGLVGDASDLSMLQDNTFDVVIMSFGLFVVKDAVASKAAGEILRVLKPKGILATTAWKESWVERMLTGLSKAVGRPEDEAPRFNIGKWLKMETTRDTLVAGGFEVDKIQPLTVDYYFTFKTVDEFQGQFSTPFWLGIGAQNWTTEQKEQWRPAIAGLLTENEKETGRVPSHMWLFVAKKMIARNVVV